MKKKIFSMLVLLMTAVTGAWAQEQSETIATTANLVEGTHFTISDNDNWADEYGMLADEGITVTSKNGETITKVVISCTYQPGDVNDGNTSVSSGTKEITNGGGTITVTGVNASTFTFTCSDYGPQFGQFVVYYTEAPAESSVTVTEITKNQWQFTMPDYAVVANVEYETELELQEENVNTTVLADWDGYEADITLKRTLVAGSWNTLAVPFNVEATWLAYLKSQYGMEVKLLTSTSISGETIYLNFEDAQTIEAGKPYLVKVTSDFDFSAQAFPGIEVSKDPVPVETDHVNFIPTLGKTTITGDDATSILFLAAENKLKNPTSLPSDMKGFRAYFQLKNASTARSFSLNLGDESTGIESLTASPMGEGSIYTLDGRRIGKAAQKGVYIQNGKKTIIK